MTVRQRQVTRHMGGRISVLRWIEANWAYLGQISPALADRDILIKRSQQSVKNFIKP